MVKRWSDQKLVKFITKVASNYKNGIDKKKFLKNILKTTYQQEKCKQKLE